MTDIDTIAREICTVAGQYTKPIYASFMGEADVATGINILQRNKIPHYILPETMPMAFASAFNFGRHVTKLAETQPEAVVGNKKFVQEILTNAASHGRTFLPEPDAVQILRAYGLPVPACALATSGPEAVANAEKIGFPVVMKIVSDDIVHKFDVHGVVLNIRSRSEVEAAYDSIIKNVKTHQPDARIQGVFVSQMISKGQEIILGIKRDPAFGAVVMFGLGGIYVEIFRDVSFRIVPVNRESARLMIQEIKSSAILLGARGTVPKDLPSLENCILALSQLALDFPQIKELDINPLIVLEQGKGSFIADAKIML